MEINLINTKKFVVINKLQEVKNPITFEKGSVPSSDGLLSTDIFGVSMKSRKQTFAYINLHAHFFHPFIFKMIKRMNRKFEECIYGSKTFTIKNGDLVEDENGETGIEFLYKNWEKFEFKKNYSRIRNERIDVLTAYDKDTIFTNFWIVIPPFYRDVNLQQGAEGKISHHEINDKYSKLLRLCSAINTNNNFDFIFNHTNAKIQSTLVEIYDLLKGNLEKKNGLIRKSLLGKSIDYGARSVITAPTFNANHPDEMDVSFYRSGIPLAQTCANFTPFVVSWVKHFFERELEKTGSKYPVRDPKTKEIMYIELKEPALYFNEDFITKKLERFIHSTGDRFEKVVLPVIDKKYEGKVFLSFAGRNYQEGIPESESPLINRPATWTDIFYQACYNAVEEPKEMGWITRYPLLDYFGMLPTYIFVHSTKKTVPMFIGDKVYKRYPDIDPNLDKAEVSTSFIDSVTMSNLYLQGLGGDYDGDQVSIRGVFSQEAKIEAEKIMKSKANILNVYGQNMRKTTNEGVQTLYMMTKFD